MNITLDDGAIMPTRANPTDAGLDLYALETVEIPFMRVCKVNTGVHVQLPEGTYGELRLRSGTASKKGLVTVTSGVIDEGYIGPLILPVAYVADDVTTLTYQLRDSVFIERGERFAQLLVLPCIKPVLNVVESLQIITARGEGGFGSTGNK